MLEKYKAMANGCSRCGMCIVGEAGYVCPAQVHSGGFDQYVARGRNMIAKAIIQGELDYSEDIMNNTYTCLGCNSCHEQCTRMDVMTGTPGLIDESKLTQSLRVDLFRAGFQPEACKRVDGNIGKSGNPFGEPESKRAAWAEGLGLPKSGDTVYFAGCYAAYRSPKIAKSTVALLRSGGIDVAFLGEDEWCCGIPEQWDGNISLSEQLVQRNMEALKSSGAKKVITSCAGCFHALKSEYPEIIGELPFEVVHISEVLSELVSAGKLKSGKALSETVTYHDPCHLGRHESVYDAPRDVLKAIPGINLVEMPRTGANAWCCGGGAVVSNVFPDFSGEIAQDRVDEAAATGAGVIVSTCPSCEDGLTTGARKANMKVYDLTVLVAEALELSI